MELEDVTEDRKVGAARLVEIQPKEASRREQTLNGLAVEMNLLGAQAVDDVAHRRTSSIPQRGRNSSFLRFDGCGGRLASRGFFCHQEMVLPSGCTVACYVLPTLGTPWHPANNRSSSLG